MTEEVLNTIREYSMMQKGDKVIAALSGGADSVCLLLILSSLRKELDFTLSAVHLNHMIRGSEADSDERFCVRLCERIGIPIDVYHEDIPKYAEESGRSIEQAARDVRYRIFYRAAGENAKIATAHTLSDSAETVMLNLIRGTGLKGLCGIPPVRGRIIRPLIGVTRADVENYLEALEQDFVTDSTNLSDDYTRNRIRHKIIPEFFNINSGFYKNFTATQKILREENNYLENLTEIAYNNTYSEGTLKFESSCPDVIRKRVILRFLREQSLPISFEKIDEINELSRKNGKISIGRDTFLTSRKGIIFAEKKAPTEELVLNIGENRLFDSAVLEAFEEGFDGAVSKNILDPDKVSGRIILRARRDGDKIKLVNRDFTSSVKKLLNEQVAPPKRQFTHFLADDEGLIFMEGFGCADRVKADENTKRILKIEIHHRK